MSRYDEVYGEYVKELTEARAEVMDWWQAMMTAESEPTGNFEAAERNVRTRWPAGQCSHPRIIHVYRKYFLQCEKLNDGVREQWNTAREPDSNGWSDESSWGTDSEFDDGGVVEPQYILLERLEIDDKDLGEFMYGLVFSPIGSDDNGEIA